MKSALIFDCDGVLADGEIHAHLHAFNLMWQEQGIPWQWSIDEYKKKLKISGGKERLATLYTDPAFRAAVPISEGQEAWLQLVKYWHQRKTEIYQEIIEAREIPPRSGVRRLAAEALAHNWLVAVASSGAYESVHMMVEHTLGKDIARHVTICAGDIVPLKKPAPDIYLYTAQHLNVPPINCLAIEDTQNGLRAALAAQVQCIVTPTELTIDQDFSAAALVLSCLGDPHGQPCRVLQNTFELDIGEYVQLHHLAALRDFSTGWQPSSVTTANSPYWSTTTS